MPNWLAALQLEPHPGPVPVPRRVTLTCSLTHQRRSQPPFTQMFPVRVTVETVRAHHCLSCAHDGHILVDTYAIVSGSTVLSQLVETVLSALGHPQLALNARGLVQVSNWKALPFEQITDNPDETVQSLFKDISGHITLRILTKPSSSDSASTQCITDLKQRLLKTAVSKNPQILNSVDNQQIKELINQVIAGDDPAILNHEQINSINEWLETLDQGYERRSPIAQSRFNQLFEVPKLEKWFKTDSSPSRQKLLNYMNILNGSSYRRNHQKISYQQICNWFANQRASTRRPALAAAHTQVNQQVGEVPSIPTMLPDFRPKFDFNNIIESCQKSSNGDESRIDGGSDSPTPNDDELHSNSDGAEMSTFPHIKQVGEESTASSPDLSVINSLASSSPKHIPNDLSMGNNLSGMGIGSQAARSRLMFDPLTELPILEKWFEENPHPTWIQIDQYTQMLNGCPYRENYPHISQHNVKIWFKNRRAKCKRMQTGMVEKLEKLFA